MSSGASSEKKDVARNVPDPDPGKGDAYIWRCICVASRLRVANHLSKTREIQDAKAFLTRVRSQIASGQLLVTSDKLRAYPQALLDVFGDPEPEPEKLLGRPRVHRRKVFPPGFLYGQIDKERVHGHLVAVERRALVGTMDQISFVLDRDNLCKVINTSFVERDNLSVRQHNGRLVRKTLSYSKNWQMHQYAIDFEDAVHNFVRPHFSLRMPLREQYGPCLWQPQTPAMAAGITDHVWSMRELVTYRPPPR